GDRLRPGRPAGRDTRGHPALARHRDLPRLPAAGPSHPDDHRRRRAGGRAAGAGLGRRGGTAPAARRRRGRRPDAQPVPDARAHARAAARPEESRGPRPTDHDEPGMMRSFPLLFGFAAVALAGCAITDTPAPAPVEPPAAFRHAAELPVVAPEPLQLPPADEW